MSYEIYHDKHFGLEIHYTLFPPDTVYPPEVELQEIMINGDKINLNLESMLFEEYGAIWETEILKEVQP